VIAAAFAEAHAFQLVRHTVRLPPGPPVRCRILHLSDTHFRRGERAKAAFLAALTDTKPDLVVFTGDTLADDPSLDEFLDAISGLLALPGVFVRGSNDYFGPQWSNPLAYLRPGPRGHGTPRHRLNWHRLTDALVDAGWHDLNNASARLTLPNLTIECRGTEDAHQDWDDYPQAIASTTQQDTPDLQLGVTHSPYRRVLTAMAEDGADLILAGHTHGGQICLPWHGAVVSNCDLPPSLAKGVFWWPTDAPDRVPVHVTAGVGASPNFPFRLFCRPEACLLEVDRESVH